MQEKITVFISEEGYSDLQARLAQGDLIAISASQAFDFRILSKLERKEWGL